MAEKPNLHTVEVPSTCGPDGDPLPGAGSSDQGDNSANKDDSFAQPVQTERVEDTNQLSNTRMFLIGTSMMLTYFLGTSSAVAVTLVIPDLAADLGVSALDVQWVSSAYTLAYGCGLLFAGRIADLYNRKIVYLTGLSLFFIFNILSAVIRVRVPLCVMRALSGLGLAIAIPAGYGIVGSNIRQDPWRTTTFAAFGVGGPVGASVGTILGGAVAGSGRHGWTYLFYILAACSLVPFTLVLLVVPRDDRILRGIGIDRRIDWVGGVMVTLSTSLFLFSIGQSGVTAKGWRTPYVPTILALSLVIFTIFLLWEHHLEHRTTFPPLLKPSLFVRHKCRITALTLIGFAVPASVYGFVYVATIWYQDLKGMNAIENAVHMLPCNIMGLFAAGGVMWLAPRVKAPILLGGGAVLSGLTSLLFAVEPSGTNYWKCEFIALLCLPWGIDFAVGLGTILISNLVDDTEQAVGGALFQTSVQIGGSLGTCLASLISTQRTEATGSLLNGLRTAGYMNAAWAWVVPFIVFVSIRKVGLAKDAAKIESIEREEH
ncbi:major facilitator superfamily-domain-containing protein [Naematelia encephala]|uniref:Major facilitator superfamily-domain-containing protein n=1 Tax=Naematelia encephala TaxID=71784 RepID=A0A1Y2AJM4_9TREE|nr:major facilitator superfamily-domain-containing protein [Naematelia encephala]